MQQILDGKQIVQKIIDEFYRPKNYQEKLFLEDLVEEEMLSRGFDPLNKEDVQRYWKSKGIEANG